MATKSLSIECAKRPEGSKPKAMRREGKLPATIYGHSGTESVQVMVDAKAMDFLLRDAIERKTKIEVTVPEMKWTTHAVLQDVHKHPWKGSIYHVSFFADKATKA
jgi:large subunit ribosomal protein L25